VSIRGSKGRAFCTRSASSVPPSAAVTRSAVTTARTSSRFSWRGASTPSFEPRDTPMDAAYASEGAPPESSVRILPSVCAR
jgi:hypothetical protein